MLPNVRRETFLLPLSLFRLLTSVSVLIEAKVIIELSKPFSYLSEVVTMLSGPIAKYRLIYSVMSAGSYDLSDTSVGDTLLEGLAIKYFLFH